MTDKSFNTLTTLEQLSNAKLTTDPSEIAIVINLLHVYLYDEQTFDLALCLQLLPIFKTAESAEPYLNAIKFTLLFKSYQQAISYLKRFDKQPFATTIDAACSFVLPKSNEWTIATWQDLVAHHKPNSPHDLLLRLLPYTSQIETYVKEHEDHIKQEISAKIKNEYIQVLLKHEREINNQTTNNTSTLFSQVASGFNKFTEYLGWSNNERLIDKYHLRGTVKSVINSVYEHIFSSRTSLNQLLKYANGCYYQYGYKNLSAAEVFYTHRMSEDSFNHYSWLTPKDNEKFIPYMEVLGSTIAVEYKQYYLKKLNPHEAIAALLGLLTSSCQIIDDRYGNGPTLHGICDERGGFYVLYKMTGNYPSAEDKIVAQTWAWRGKKNEMVFDSIEVQKDVRRHNAQMVDDFYTYLADQLVKTKNVPCVLAGIIRHPNVEYTLGELRPLELAEPVGYCEYRDSHVQRLVAHKNLPLLNLYKRIHLNSLLETENKEIAACYADEWNKLCFQNLAQPIREGKCDLLDALINLGFDINYCNPENENLLKIAEKSKRMKIIEHILECGGLAPSSHQFKLS